jgi:hypothetical protein
VRIQIWVYCRHEGHRTQGVKFFVTDIYLNLGVWVLRLELEVWGCELKSVVF